MIKAGNVTLCKALGSVHNPEKKRSNTLLLNIPKIIYHLTQKTRQQCPLSLPRTQAQCKLSYSPRPSPIFYFNIESHQLSRLPRLGSNLRSSCFTLPECWDYSFGFVFLKQSLTMLPSVASKSQLSCLSLLQSWDYRSVPPLRSSFPKHCLYSFQ